MSKSPLKQYMLFADQAAAHVLDAAEALLSYFGAEAVGTQLKKWMNGGKSLIVSQYDEAYADIKRLYEQFGQKWPSIPTPSAVKSQLAADREARAEAVFAQQNARSHEAKRVNQKRIKHIRAQKEQSVADYDQAVSDYNEYQQKRDHAYQQLTQQANERLSKVNTDPTFYELAVGDVNSEFGKLKKEVYKHVP